jgi:hypothetical protein
MKTEISVVKQGRLIRIEMLDVYELRRKKIPTILMNSVTSTPRTDSDRMLIDGWSECSALLSSTSLERAEPGLSGRVRSVWSP